MKYFMLFILVCIFSFNLYADDNFSYSGYFKNFFSLHTFPHIEKMDDYPPAGISHNKLRLDASLSIIKELKLFTGYDLYLITQDPIFYTEIFEFTQNNISYRIDDLNEMIYPEKNNLSSFSISQNLDRFYFKYRFNFADIYFGRQTIARGSAHVINPTDIFFSYQFNELDTEERKGVDALRIRIPYGMMNEIDLGYVAGKDLQFDKSGLFLRNKLYLFKTDISLSATKFKKHFLIGADLTRALARAGSWLEAAYIIPEENTDYQDRNFFRVSLGLDYNFTSKLYSYFEYHFNGVGKTEVNEYNELQNNRAYLDANGYLLGKNYLAGGLNYQFRPLIPINLLLIANLHDSSIIAAPTTEYNIAENVYLQAGCYLGLGKSPVDNLFDYQSEFGTYNNIYYTSFGVYF